MGHAASQHMKPRFDILVIGTNASQRATILREIKISQHGGFSNKELHFYRTLIRKRVLQSAQAVVEAMDRQGIEFINRSNQHLSLVVARGRSSKTNASTEEELLPSDIAFAIHHICQDPAFVRFLDENTAFFASRVMEAPYHYFSQAMHIGSPSYQPSNLDILSLGSVGVEGSAGGKALSTEMTIESLSGALLKVHDVEGTPRLDCRKWIKPFQDVTAVVFQASLAEYDLPSVDKHCKNQLEETFLLFRSMIKSCLSRQTAVIVLLTDWDLLTSKLINTPFHQKFPSYTGANNRTEVTKFVLSRFKKIANGEVSISSHVVSHNHDNVYHRITQAITAAVDENAMRNALVRVMHF